MRGIVVGLLALNLLFFAWSHGWLDRVTGVPAQGGREPQRLQAQQHPERIQPLAASAVAALNERLCLALGPLAGDAALAAAQAALRAAGADAQVRSSEQPGVWAVATIRLENADFRARKEATYRQMRLAYEPLTGLPAEQPSFVLSRHASAAEAQAALAALERRNLRGLRVLTLKPPVALHALVVQADGLMANRLRASTDPALAAGLRPCNGAAGPAASAPSAAH